MNRDLIRRIVLVRNAVSHINALQRSGLCSMFLQIQSSGNNLLTGIHAILTMYIKIRNRLHLLLYRVLPDYTDRIAPHCRIANIRTVAQFQYITSHEKTISRQCITKLQQFLPAKAVLCCIISRIYDYYSSVSARTYFIRLFFPSGQTAYPHRNLLPARKLQMISTNHFNMSV